MKQDSAPDENDLSNEAAPMRVLQRERRKGETEGERGEGVIEETRMVVSGRKPRRCALE